MEMGVRGNIDYGIGNGSRGQYIAIGRSAGRHRWNG